MSQRTFDFGSQSDDDDDDESPIEALKHKSSRQTVVHARAGDDSTTTTKRSKPVGRPTNIQRRPTQKTKQPQPNSSTSTKRRKLSPVKELDDEDDEEIEETKISRRIEQEEEDDDDDDDDEEEEEARARTEEEEEDDDFINLEDEGVEEVAATARLKQTPEFDYVYNAAVELARRRVEAARKGGAKAGAGAGEELMLLERMCASWLENVDAAFNEYQRRTEEYSALERKTTLLQREHNKIRRKTADRVGEIRRLNASLARSRQVKETKEKYIEEASKLHYLLRVLRGNEV